LSSFDNLENIIRSRCGAGLARSATDEQAGRVVNGQYVSREIVPLATGSNMGKSERRLREATFCLLKSSYRNWSETSAIYQQMGNEREAATSQGDDF
jgi:hypothetical protein